MFLIFSLLTIFGYELNISNAIPNEEYLSLIDFYQSTNGDNWYINYGWNHIITNINTASNNTNNTNNTINNLCDYEIYGIECDATKTHISSIIFLDNNLNGTISNSVGNLHYLFRFIIKWEPNLFGCLPNSFYNLTNIALFEVGVTNLTLKFDGRFCNFIYLEYFIWEESREAR